MTAQKILSIRDRPLVSPLGLSDKNRVVGCFEV